MLSAGAVDVGRRVDDAAVLVDFEVDVGAGGAASIARQGDDLALLDDVAGFDQELFVVGVEGFVTVAVIDIDHLAVALFFPGIGDDAGGHRLDVDAGAAGGEIDAGVPRQFAGEGIDAASEGRGYPAAVDRAAGQEGVILDLLFGQQGIEEFELLPGAT